MFAVTFLHVLFKNVANSEGEPVCFLAGEGRNGSLLARRGPEVLLGPQRQGARAGSRGPDSPSHARGWCLSPDKALERPVWPFPSLTPVFSCSSSPSLSVPPVLSRGFCLCSFACIFHVCNRLHTCTALMHEQHNQGSSFPQQGSSLVSRSSRASVSHSCFPSFWLQPCTSVQPPELRKA